MSTKEGAGDDYADFMERAQAKFKERNAILQSSTPNTKEKYLNNVGEDRPSAMISSIANEVLQSSTPKVKKKFMEISKENRPKLLKSSAAEEPIRFILNKPAKVTELASIEQPDQSVKENIKKFEQMASNSPATLFDERPRRKFESQTPKKLDSSADPLRQTIKPAVSKMASLPDERLQQDVEPSVPKPAQPFNECLDQIKETLAPKLTELSDPNSHQETKSLSPKSPDERVRRKMESSTPKPVVLFGQRLRQTMEPLTPKRARLMDEINEDFKKHSNSLPRRPSRIVNFDEEEANADDAFVVSLKEYRQNSLDRKATSSSAVEKLTYAPPQNVDMPDGAVSKKKADKARQLDDFIAICNTQYDQAKKALMLTISKPGRGEDEFIAANHILLNHRVVLEAALRMRKGIEKRTVTKLADMHASFTIHSVTFELDPEYLHDLYVACYFTLVIGYNETTRCSMYFPYVANNRCRMTIDFYCAIKDVEPGFEIYVEVYMMKIPKHVTEKRSTFVDTVGTLLRGDKQVYRNSDHRYSSSSFERIGSAVINQQNMKQQRIPANVVEPLAPQFDILFDYVITESKHRMEGYLRRFETVAGVGNWAMEYMMLENWFVDSWPTQREKLENKPPTRSTNLRRCLEVSEVSDSACYPHAFLINYTTEEGQKERLLLAARSKEEQEQWLQMLKSFIDGLKYWS